MQCLRWQRQPDEVVALVHWYVRIAMGRGTVVTASELEGPRPRLHFDTKHSSSRLFVSGKTRHAYSDTARENFGLAPMV